MLVTGGTAPEEAAAVLARAGVELPAGPLRVQRRGDRSLVRLAEDRVAWIAATPAAAARMGRERRVLRLLAERCRFDAPRVVLEADDGTLDVRTVVSGTADAQGVYRRAERDPGLAARIGRGVGAILAEQHTRIGAADAARWLPRRPQWPLPRAEARELLPRHARDRELAARAGAVLAACEALPVAESERALVHGDLGFHNLVFDPAALAVRGVFDYDEAAWADRTHDFRYLLFGWPTEAVYDAAVAVYEPAAGRAVSRGRALLYNAGCAISFLATRGDARPEDRPCGRTLREDLEWTGGAIERALEAGRRGEFR